MPTQRKVPEKITALQKAYWRASEAREVLDLWRRSGASLSEFARGHALCRNRLARWRDRLAGEASSAPTPRFHPVRLVERRDAPLGVPPDTGGIEVLTSGGCRLVVRPGF